LAGTNLVADKCQSFRIGADEDNLLLFTAPGKIRVFSKEAIAGMDDLCTGLMGNLDDALHVQVAVDGCSRADADRLISHLDMKAAAVNLGVNGHCRNRHLLAGFNDADSNLSPIGNKYFFKHNDYLLLSQKHPQFQD